MGRLCNRARHVEVENGFCSGSFFCDAPPPRAPTPSCTVPMKAIAHKINVDVLVRRPMPLKIVEKCRPIVRKSVFLEIPQGKLSRAEQNYTKAAAYR